MNRTVKILIAIAVAVLLLLVGVAVLYNPDPVSNLELSQITTIKNLEGDDVTVPNLYDIASVNHQDVPVIEDNDKFTIQYDTKNNVFQIYLKLLDEDDLDAYRLESEEALASKLLLSIDELCTLAIVQVVPDNGVVTLPVYNYGPKNCET